MRKARPPGAAALSRLPLVAGPQGRPAACSVEAKHPWFVVRLPRTYPQFHGAVVRHESVGSF